MSGTSSFSCWLASILLAFGFLFVTSCGEDEVVEEEVAIEVPTAYTFDSRFIEGKSSVSYSGQTVRNLLWQDLKILTDRLGKSGSKPVGINDLNQLYDYKDSYNLKSLTTAGAAPLAKDNYTAISTG